jgi:hypothetical protein
MSQIGPEDPPPQQEPTHDIPVYPEEDPPPGSETAIEVAAGPRERDREREGQREGQSRSDLPNDGDDDVDEDDLDPQAPHSPPDARKGRVLFRWNQVAR